MADLTAQGTPNGDGNEGTPPATSSGEAPPQTQTPATAANNDGAGATGAPASGKTFTQADLDRIAGEARASARSRVLSDLGYDDPEKAKADLEAFKKLQREQLSEVEQLKADLAAATATGEQLTAATEQIEALNTIIKAQVEAQMKTLEVPEYVKPLLEGMTPQEQLAYLTEHGASFIKEQAKTKKPATNAAGKGGGSENAADRKAKVRAKYNIQ